MDRHAVDNLLKSRQLEPVTHGVYLRPGTRVNWERAVASLQNMFRLDLTPGGLTALEPQGFAHYLPISRRRQVHLYGKNAIPKWLVTALPDVEFVRHFPLPGLGATGLGNFEYETQERILSGPDTPRAAKKRLAICSVLARASVSRSPSGCAGGDIFRTCRAASARYDDALAARDGEAFAKVYPRQSEATLLLDGGAPFLRVAQKTASG